MEDGVIKYTIDWQNENQLTETDIKMLNECRTLLWQKKLIGIDESGVGYGNISIRHAIVPNSFIISGTQTGQHQTLTTAQYALVTKWKIKNNSLFCIGNTRASSEALTHAIFYEYNTDYKAVIHIHNDYIWQKYLHKLPTTPQNIAYGTPMMADSVRFLLSSKRVNLAQKVIIMGGHKDGILAFGESLQAATQTLLDLYHEVPRIADS